MIQFSFNEFPDNFSCLAVETSTAVSTVAVCAGGRIARAEYGSPGQRSREVYAHVRDVLRDVGITLQDLDCVAFGCGPGGFTGLRIGAAVAQALAFGVNLPVCRISSLAVLAAAAMRANDVRRVAACLDARMGEAYLGVYHYDDQRLHAVLPDRLVTPDDFRLPEGDDVFAAGGGWSAFPRLAESNAAQLTGQDSEVFPVADVLLLLAAQEFSLGHTVVAHEAVPNYVRDKVTS